MNILDQFRDYGLFLGESPRGLTEENLSKMIEAHGEAWVVGYLDALQVVAANLSDILYPDKVCGVAQTPHKVKKDVKAYWQKNQTILSSLLPQIELAQNCKSHLTPDP